MRSLMIEHAAKIPEINPSAARFALDEMLGFVLVRISVLGNIFSARDLHSSLLFMLSPLYVFTGRVSVQSSHDADPRHHGSGR